MLIKTRIKSSTELSSFKMLTVCPFLAVTTTVSKSFAMALAFAITLILAQLIVTLFRKLIPLKLRTLFYVTVTAFSASLCELLFLIFVPDVAKSLGIYLPILAVNCIILVRLESTKAETQGGVAILDSLLTAVQMFCVLVGAGLIRELFGFGTLLSDINGNGGIVVFKNAPIPLFATTVGVLLLAGIFSAVAKLIVKKSKSSARRAKLN